ncbi:C40 family peptidase [Arthrobacter sp. H14-L1]|uniref:C40 family peptidase n=1 Tax=Arthrobacter sp. H14-L1 TaxID=2996697 RepID=UPI002D1E48CA|nr:NlpC/P60 family protein [Arthrobacter sp. H14-L1]
MPAALATLAKAKLIQRVLGALVVAVPVGVVAVLSGTTALIVSTAGSETSCTSTTQGTTAATVAGQTQSPGRDATTMSVKGPDGRLFVLDSQQQGVAAAYMRVGTSLAVPDTGIQISIMVALQESGLRMLANPAVPASLGMPHDGVGYDHDSIGSAQQRPSAGWGTVQELMTPSYDAEAFFGGPNGPNQGSPRGLLDVHGWQSMTLGAAAQAVQASAFPELYERWAPTAQAIIASLRGSGGLRHCSPQQPNANEPTVPVPGNLSGMRQAILRYAQEGVGGSYVWGGTAFKAWDCSGYVQWVYAQAGIQLPRTEQWATGHPTSTPQPGDLVVQNPDGPNHWGHVGIYAGAGVMYSALNPSAGTLLHPVAWNTGTQYFTLLG